RSPSAYHYRFIPKPNNDTEENAMQEFIAKHQDKIAGTLSGFDRLVFRGHLRSIGEPDLGCSSHPRRTSHAGLRGLGANHLPVDEACTQRSRAGATLAGLPAKSPRG